MHILEPLESFNLKNNWGLEKVINIATLLKKDYLKDFNNKYIELLDKSLELLAGYKYKEEEKRVIIHGDLFKDNVFVSDNKIVGIIDFYFACLDNYLYDLAVVIVAWCFDNEDNYSRISLNENFINSFLRGYNTIPSKIIDHNIKFNNKDLQMLTLQAATRFFCTRLYDKFNYNKTANVKIKSVEEYYWKILILYNKILGK